MDVIHKFSPNVSRSDQAVEALSQILRDAESNRVVLLAYVLGGKRKFRNVVRRELGNMAITDKQLDLAWCWLHYRRGEDPKFEFEQLCEQAAQRKYAQEAEQAALADLHDKAHRRMD